MVSFFSEFVLGLKNRIFDGFCETGRFLVGLCPKSYREKHCSVGNFPNIFVVYKIVKRTLFVFATKIGSEYRSLLEI